MDINKKLKLLFITYTYSNGGGAEKVLTTFVNNLDSTKYDISIFEIVKYNVKREPINSNIKLLPSLYCYNDPNYKIKVLDYLLEQKPEIIRSLRSLDAYDIIISWNYQKPSFMLPAFEDKKTIAWFHESIDGLRITNPEPGLQYYRSLQIEAWKYADKIVAISNKCFTSLGEVFPEYLNKTEIVYNPIELDEIRTKAKINVMDDFKKHGFPFLICIGRLDKNKNISLVIHSLAKLNRMGIPCGLLVVGMGEEERNLKEEAKTLNISDNIFFLGYQQNPISYLNKAIVLCVASFSEGWGLTVCEAMALGIPFVTTPVAGASEELAYGGKCGLVADWNVDDYAEKLKILLTDVALYNKMSNNCLERIKDFSVENAIVDFNNLLASLPEKENIPTRNISKIEAIKQIHAIYVWYPDNILKNIKFSVNRFKNTKKIYHFLLIGYHIAQFLLYGLTTPYRIFTVKNTLGV